MKVANRTSIAAAITLSAALSAGPKAMALLRMNDGRDQVFVTLSGGVAYDSNIYSANGGGGDFLTNAGLSIDYLRKAGLIGVNGSIGWSFSQFDKFAGENFSTPSMNLELTKSTGRTTGSLSMGVARSNKPDIDANIRTESWDYHSTLALRYPVIERYSIAGSLGYSARDYTDNGTALYDQQSYTASSDLYYTWTSERDLFFGYRYRQTDSNGSNTSTDHGLSAGVSGKILAKLNGSLRVGVQERITQPSGGGPEENHTGINAAMSATWTVTRRLSTTTTIARDFNTTSTGSNTESTTLTVDGQYAVNAKFSLNARASAGINDYIDSTAGDRRDTFYSYGVGFSYIIHPHLTISGSYDYFSNSSSIALSDFDRHSVSLNLSSRW